MFCTNCAQQIADGARFCTHCGNATAAVSPTIAKKILGALLVLVGAAIVFGGCFIVYGLAIDPHGTRSFAEESNPVEIGVGFASVAAVGMVVLGFFLSRKREEPWEEPSWYLFLSGYIAGYMIIDRLADDLPDWSSDSKRVGFATLGDANEIRPLKVS
jgi:hypothetical protein